MSTLFSGQFYVFKSVNRPSDRYTFYLYKTFLNNCSPETLEGYLANRADLGQIPQNAASDQSLHCLQVVQPFFSCSVLIALPGVPKIESRIFKFIVWGSSFSLQWVNMVNRTPHPPKVVFFRTEYIYSDEPQRQKPCIHTCAQQSLHHDNIPI